MRQHKQYGKEDVSATLRGPMTGAVLLAVLFFLLRMLGVVDVSGITVFNTVFISILMQAFPFMLVGVLVASLLHVFVSDERIVKIFPIRHGWGFLTALFAGIFFPVCECAIVPVMTRLVKKGVSLPIAVTFMLAAPIINPIVIASTLYAFRGEPEVAILRVGLGLFIALLAGIALSMFYKDKTMLLPQKSKDACDCDPANGCVCSSCATGGGSGFLSKAKQTLLHAGEEFFEVGKYLVIGAAITSLLQTLIPREVFVGLSTRPGFSLLIMMAMAFLFSACSTSDAFIARSFTDKLPMGAVMGFMVYGPMMDMKNVLMLLANFKRSFVLKLCVLITVLNFAMLYFFALFY